MIQPIYIKGDNNQLYKQLDAAPTQRAHYVELKEKKLKRNQARSQVCYQQRRQIKTIRTTRQRLQSLRVRLGDDLRKQRPSPCPKEQQYLI